MPNFGLLVLKSLGSYMQVFTVYFMGDQASDYPVTSPNMVDILDIRKKKKLRE